MSLKVVFLSLLGVGASGVAVTGGYLYLKKDSLDSFNNISKSHVVGDQSANIIAMEPGSSGDIGSEAKGPEVSKEVVEKKVQTPPKVESQGHEHSCSSFLQIYCWLSFSN